METSLDALIETETGIVDVGEEAMRRLSYRKVWEAGTQLSHEHWTAVVLKRYEGFGYDEIAKVMGCSVGTAKSRVHYGLKQLREALLWGAFALFTNLIGLLIYLLVKSITPRLCLRCQRAMEEHFKACPYCGPIRTRLCEKCGASVQSDWNFCPVCQMPLIDKADVPKMTAE